MPSYIDDGYTIEATIPAGGSDAPAFQITYRPLLGSERNRLNVGIARAAESGDNDRMVEWETRLHKALAEHLKSWTLKDRNGKLVKISSEAIPRIHPLQFEWLYNFVGGYSEPKTDGAESEEESDLKNS